MCGATAKAALDAGVAERQVRVVERYGAAIAFVLKGVLEDLGLNAAQSAHPRSFAAV